MYNLNDPEEVVDPKSDPRPVEELISATLSSPHDDDAYWPAIQALQWRGTREVLGRASSLCRSSCPVERRVGADILGQLGCPDRSFPEECCRILAHLLRVEREANVVSAALVALSHHTAPEAIGLVSRFSHHANSEVRYGVVLALMGYELEEAIEPLIELTRDPNAQVRDWATFALGSQVDFDSPELREALIERMADEDDDARDEAIVGLAQRGDLRVIPVLQSELGSGSVGRLNVEAAAKIGAPSLYPLLTALQGRWDVDESLLQEAIQACSPEIGSSNPDNSRTVG